jgi:hypothetical protein
LLFERGIYPLLRVAEVAAFAETAFEVAERATMRVESLLVVRELAVVDRTRLLLVREFASVIGLSYRCLPAPHIQLASSAARNHATICTQGEIIFCALPFSHKLPRARLVLCYSDAQH